MNYFYVILEFASASISFLTNAALITFGIFMDSYSVPLKLAVASKSLKTNIAQMIPGILMNCFDMLSQSATHPKFFLTDGTLKVFYIFMN